MPKCIKVKCFQSFASYKKPMSVNIEESFPLPPYSTVIGLIHNIAGFKEYHDLEISIQGINKSVVNDLYTRYFFGIKYDPSRHQFSVVNENGTLDGITKGLGYVELMTDVELLFHILPKNDADYEVILNAFKNPKIYPSLGRYDDLLRIDNVSEVSLDKTENLKTGDYNAYVPESIVLKSINYKDVESSMYNLNKVYNIKDNKRNWQKVKVYHLTRNSILLFNDSTVYNDSDGDSVFLA